ncbi:branched-chain amino acid ABC transporter permease [Kitasatospora sp. MMS16-BH015]|uniref:branched-chain amino acid ABC transporter permease n=1 Tax=Kitasatospora sp. MMS16-BH015 TaxID=2018025 RepID=UPI000CA1D983|nr:branched-chain amino acid ABC transporter permease [Kitasatospora sp. MMS16-BH015]AUG76606.1 branched-chain amino acid ABC transporter permease [Kitasatospora sp. MMS16-BH015]
MTTSSTTETSPVIPFPAAAARATTAVGALATAASAFLAWTWTSDFPGDLTVTGYPGGLQWLSLVAGVVTLVLVLASYGLRGLRWVSPTGSQNAILLAATGSTAVTWFTLIAISVELGGLANLEPGGWVAGVASAIGLVGALGLPLDRHVQLPPRIFKWWLFLSVPGSVLLYLGAESLDASRPVTPVLVVLTQGLMVGAGFLVLVQLLHLVRSWLRLTTISRPVTPAVELSSWLEILLIIAAFSVGMFVITYGIGTDYAELFAGFMIVTIGVIGALFKSGLIGRLRALTIKHRPVTTGAAFAAAASFPFTQTSDQYTSVATNILIFSTVSLGLNIVVGLVGLLDLGYVAFLGVGAYASALVSGSPASPIHVQFPFWAAVLTGAVAAIVFGVLIGAPTLRLRGDYLAIVTLGFGEIFRITMNNLNGTTGPKVTNGSNGIPRIPDLEVFGFDFGKTHTIAGVDLGRFSNYYLLLLLVTAFVILVFARVSNSRIGRAWVAIREDETAAEAMGINGFRLKLIAFALGAFLAGLAGSVQAHVSYTVTPDQYTFAEALPPNSAFLLAGVILGGMGTITGPLFGAALLYLLPKKLQFLSDYQLLAFGITLIVLMRVRPEGLIPNRRRQLEFHEADIPAQSAPADVAATKAGA